MAANDGIAWTWLRWGELDRDRLYELLRARQDVFVVEQDCPYPDIDGKDDIAWHLIGRDGPTKPLLAAARVFAPGGYYPEAAIGRILTTAGGRGRGLGRAIMAECHRFVAERFDSAIRLNGQAYLKAFYEGLGYRVVRGPYDEDGNPPNERLRPRCRFRMLRPRPKHRRRSRDSLAAMETVPLNDPAGLALVAGVLLLAGVVKGVVGLGLPTVTLALLTATTGLEAAVAVMLLPSLVTNLWQALAGGAFRGLLRRLWAFLAALAAGAVLASAAPTVVAIPALTTLLGVSIAVYGFLGLVTPVWSAGRGREGWLSPVMGLATGVLTGMTGSFVIPSVPYLQSLGLPRDRLVQAMGMTFLVATLALGVGLGGHGLLPRGFVVLSALAVIPALAGMEIGRRLRGRLSERRFRQVLFTALLALGAWILVKPWI